MKPGEPLFEVSVKIPTWAFFTMSAISIAIAIWYALLRPFGLVASVFPLFMGIFFAYGFAKYEAIGVRSARFYYDYFDLSGKGFSGHFTYPEVRDVIKARSDSFWTPLARVQIFVNGDPTPLVLIANPTSSKLGTDLASWLASKLSTKGQVSPVVPN